MNELPPPRAFAPAPFADPDTTADGAPRAKVGFRRLETLWFNTGTLCNIACVNCYIESSPRNDRLAYLAPDDARPFLDEIDALGLGPCEIGFTGGEPFLNPHMAELADMALARGHRALILTNAMIPMRRPGAARALRDLRARYDDRLMVRVSLDHHDRARHDAERGAGGFAASVDGLRWLVREGFAPSVAGRAAFAEPDEDARAGFARLFKRHGLPIDALDPHELVLFPEMDPDGDPPEITDACWSLLNKDPADVMCASSRMVVKRKGEGRARVVSCTLLPYDGRFDLADTLAASLRPVPLAHKYCAQFCVLGGASCSA